MAKIIVQEKEITIITIENEDYISLTDMLKAKDGDFFISDWLRNRNTIEYLGIWEKIHNPDFNYGEFAVIKSQAGLNSYKLSVKEWRDKNKDKNGNIRDEADVNQLVCLANMESLNAHLINEGFSKSQRVEKLNKIAISQIRILSGSDVKELKKREIFR
jgi:hypothetical protein